MKRVQRSRARGWRMPKGAVYVGRPSLWGNPYSLNDVRAMYPEIAPADRAAAAVRLYHKEIEHFGLLSDYAWYVSGKRWDGCRSGRECLRVHVDGRVPEGPGVRVLICGAGGCAVRTSTDAGPSLAMQRAGRIVDLDVPTFEAVCGVPWTRGLCRVSVERLP